MNHRLSWTLGSAFVVASAAACSLTTGRTWDDVEREVFAVNRVAAVLQLVCALLSLKIFRWCRVGIVVPVISGVLFAVHPGLYISAHREWVYSGDCGTLSMELAALLLLAGLTVLAFQHDAATKIVEGRSVGP